MAYPFSEYRKQADFGYWGPERDTWDVSEINHTRDSDILSESNWIALLELLGGEKDTVEIHRFNHWAVGWIEIIIVDTEDIDTHLKLLKAEKDYDGYPCLDEELYSNMETEAMEKYWDEISLSEKIEYMQDHEISIFSARKDIYEIDCDYLYETIREAVNS